MNKQHTFNLSGFVFFVLAVIAVAILILTAPWLGW